MKKAISYSLFGYDKGKHENSFDFNSYLRGLMINVKCARLIYPDWEIILHTDQPTFDAWYKLFNQLKLRLVICESNTELTKAMLWRLKPIWYCDNGFTYSHVICRDLDSPLTLRERQAVEDWINSGAVIHNITDSISHNVPMMGGMVGFRPELFVQHTNFQRWEDLFNAYIFDFNIKGADQDLMNKLIYPKFESHFILGGTVSKCQHFIKGMPLNSSPHCKSEIPDIDVGLESNMIESNEICGHIGAAGWYEPKINVFFAKHKDKLQDLTEIEKEYQMFYWANENY